MRVLFVLCPKIHNEDHGGRMSFRALGTQAGNLSCVRKTRLHPNYDQALMKALLVDFDPRLAENIAYKNAMALDSESLVVSTAKVPAGTKMAVSIAGKVEGLSGGGVQWFLSEGWEKLGVVFEKVGVLK